MSCLSKDDDAAILSLTLSLAASMDEKNLARPQPLGEDKPQMNLRIHPSSSTRSASQSRPYSCFARASHSLKSLFCSCLRPSPHTTSPQFNDEPDCSPYDSNTQVVNSVTVNSSIDNTVPVKSVNDSSQFATSTSLNNNTARNTLDKTSPLPGQTNLKSSDSSTSSAASDNHSAQNSTQPSSQSNMTNSTNIAEAKQDPAKGNWNPITSVNPDSLITQVQPSSTGKHLSVPPRRAKVSAGANDNNPKTNGVIPPSGRFLLKPLAAEDKQKKCLVLDLDETLVHSSFKLVSHADYIIPVEIEGQVHNVYVMKRPGVDEFMKRMGDLFEIVVFTASLAKYADPVLDMLDIHKVIKHRLFRESCINHRGNYVKDLGMLGRDLRSVIIVDNSPASYIFHPSNAIPISSWFTDPNDTELLDLIPFLEDLERVENVTSVLGEDGDGSSAGNSVDM